MLYLKDKEKILNIRISGDMYKFIEDTSNQYEMSKSDFIRMIILWYKSIMKGE